MLAVGGFAKAMPPDPSGYDFSNAGAQETRFSGIKWLQSNYRVAWRWADEALYTDLDGSFADQDFCGAPNMGVGQNPNLPESTGCHVLKNSLVENTKVFPTATTTRATAARCASPATTLSRRGSSPRTRL